MYNLNKTILIEEDDTDTTTVIPGARSYDKYMSTYANVYVRSGVTNYSNDETFSFTTEFTIRYNKKSNKINNKFRIKYNDQYYRIIEIFEIETRHLLKIISVRKDYI